jgi:hypothetical protein
MEDEMSETPRHPMTLQRIVYATDSMASIQVQRNLEYRHGSAGPLHLDFYHPVQEHAGQPTGAVVIIGGYRDAGVPLPLGCTFKEMEMTISLAQAIAASGMAAAAYTTSDPAADAGAAIDYLDAQAGKLGIDRARIGVWAISGNVPAALSALIARREPPLRAAVLSQGYTFEFGGTAIADAARAYGFADATAGHDASDLPDNVPLFIARAGRDAIPGLNQSLDRFVAAAIERNLPITFVNHHLSPHSFELSDDSPESRRIIAAMLEFMAFHLRA